MATGYELDGRSLNPSRVNNFIFSSVSRPSSLPVVAGGYFPEIKRPGLEADHSSPSSAEIKNCGAVFNPSRLFGIMLSLLSTGTILPLLYRKAIHNRVPINNLALHYFKKYLSVVHEPSSQKMPPFKIYKFIKQTG
jgi:hypothetical protein